MLIRPASKSDVPGILAIYNDIIATSTAVYRDDPVTLEDRLAWFRSRTHTGYPILVAADESTSTANITGFSTFGDFRTGSGYRFTAEHTVHVQSAHRGRGIGTQLLLALLPHAQRLNKRTLIGGIDAENTASIRFHERLGFERVAHLRQVGFKFDRWLDLILLQRHL
ncbi:GNAT family N-acetyltransferase [Granulicella sp. S190]|uniref:GNAT family N-acetyltransferase n=1 Tax=Granulicella sp. S190 TaxID=1747226 RepID=UPI00131BFAC9|nr:GNAT family N-acetyltransferase [Granulicella sp. S190]